MPGSPAATRALEVLRILAASPEPLAAGHMAQRLGIPRASLYRLLESLAEQGFVLSVPESGTWALGVGAHELGWAYQRQDPLQRAARPIVARLVDDTGHNGHLTVLHGRDVVYVIEERAAHRRSLVTDVGVRLPAELTASGLAMLSVLTPAQLSALYPSSSMLAAREGRGPTSLAALRTLLRTTREVGHAWEEDTVTEGLASVAVPVVDRSGHPLAAIALTFGRAEVDALELDLLVGRVHAAVETLQRRLGTLR